ncbi:MAG TPA: hypothetical protein VIG47_14020 [Gemmatimonadaceae bacterium]|jgi:hypothetical protein
MQYLNPPGQRGKYSIQAFSPSARRDRRPHIWEIGTTDKLDVAEYFAASNARGATETKIVEKTDRYSNIGSVLGVWFDGKRRESV